MAMRLGAVFGLGGVGQVVGLLGAHFAFDLLAILAVGGGFGGGAFAVLLGVLVLALLILAFGILAFGIVIGRLVAVGLIAQRQMVQHGAGEPGEGLLVAQRARQLVQIVAGLALDEGPPQIDRSGDARRAASRRSGFSRTIRPSTSASGASSRDPRLAQAALEQPLFQAGGQIGGHALHGQRADRFHPRLFGRFEHGGAVRRGGAELVVHFLVVIGLAQRIGIAGAAHQRDVAGRTDCGAARAGGPSAPSATAARWRS